MKRLFLLGLAIAFAFTAMAQKGKQPKLSQEELQKIFAANDSVIKEGYKLYLYEKMNWLATDNFYAAGIPAQGSLVYEADSVLNVVFVTADQQCVWEEHLDLRTMQISRDSLHRPLTRTELDVQARNMRLLEKTIHAGLPVYQYPQDKASFNIDFVRINENVTRVYVIMGALTNNLIPFGNDFSCDFDNNDSLIASRSYHHSYIPIEWEKGTEIKKVTHSHTKDNPYVTPTDICTFMLYGYDLYGLDAMYVYSTALHSYFAFIPSEMMIITSTDAQLPSSKKSKKQGKREKK